LTKSKNFVTLTTDWGTRDYYSGAVKGKLYELIPDVTVVDITHDVKPFNVAQAGYILKNAFSHFPKGTIHIIGVDSEEFAVNDKIRSHLIVKFNDFYFIGADNGIFSLLTKNEEIQEIFELTIPFSKINGKYKYFFSERDRFVYAAAHLANGGKPEEIGNKTDNFKQVLEINPTYGSNYIKGVVIYVDNYENVVVNISEKLFNDLLKKRKFRIYFRNNSITNISNQYSDVNEHHILALFNSSGLLEIAINKANASNLLGLRLNDTVSIEFFED
jgi:S-adenosylmethionine hydrolase